MTEGYLFSPLLRVKSLRSPNLLESSPWDFSRVTRFSPRWLQICLPTWRMVDVSGVGGVEASSCIRSDCGSFGPKRKAPR